MGGAVPLVRCTLWEQNGLGKGRRARASAHLESCRALGCGDSRWSGKRASREHAGQAAGGARAGLQISRRVACGGSKPRTCVPYVQCACEGCAVMQIERDAYACYLWEERVWCDAMCVQYNHGATRG